MAKPILTDPDALEEVRKRRLLIGSCDAALFEQIQPFLGRRVLEVGAGHGNLIPHLLDRDLVVATDVDPGSISEIQRRFAKYPNVVSKIYDITHPSAVELHVHECDTVVALNILEHVDDDCAAIRNVTQILVPGGRAIIIVPAFQALYGTMDASIGHYRRYSKSDLASRLGEAGLRVEKQSYFNVLGMIGWFVNGKFLRQTVAPSSQLRLFNSIYPLVRRLESLLPSMAGLSLVSISRKPANGQGTSEDKRAEA